jgi:RNA polymerase sigma-70 factor (ECF subfamily)
LSTDAELLSRYRKGDAIAMDQLVDRHGGSVYAFVRRTLGPSTHVDDLTQEVWLRVIRRSDSFDGRSRFTTWLFTVTRNVCIDHLRRQKRRRPKITPPANEASFQLDDLADPGPPIVESLARRELTSFVEEAVADLTESQREVFLLREQTDLTFAEVAELIGVPRDTVKSRMRYALAHIRRAVRVRLSQEASAHGL